MLYDIFIDTILGGSTGYITNKYVIDMMFKKYSIFNKIRCGDSIINSKIEFVKNISTLMEKDIINAQKISNEFFMSDYNEEFENFSKSFFDECICRDSRSLRLKDIPVFYDFCSSCKDIVGNLLNSNISNIIEYLSENITLSDLITQNQIDYISKNIIQNIVLTVKNTSFTQNIASETFDAFCDVKINEIISKSMFEGIKNSIEKEAIQFGHVLHESLDDKIDSVCDEILYQCDIKKSIEMMQNEIENKPIKSFLKLNVATIRTEIVDSIIDFISTERGERAITNIYYEVIEYIVNRNLTLADLYKKDYSDILKNQLKNKANGAAYSVMNWIDTNIIELNEVIKDSIDEIISGHSELRTKLYTTITEYYSNKKNNDDSMFKLLLEFATEGDNLDKIITFIITDIDNYLKSKSAKDVITLLEDKNHISPSIFLSKILSFLNSDNKSVLDKIVDNIISKPIGEFINLNMYKLFNSKMKYVLIDYIKENTFYSRQVHLGLAKSVNNYIYTALDSTIGEILDKNIVKDSIYDINKIIIRDIENNYNSLDNSIKGIINEFINKNSILTVLDKLSETNNVFDLRASEKVTRFMSKNFSEIVDDIGDTRVSKVISMINNIPDIHSSLSDFMKNVVGESIATVTEGYINEIVEGHFDNLNDSEFIEFIKDISLINNKKLSKSGGYIGATLSLSASVASTLIFEKSLINNVFSWQGAVMCSLIGVSTNLLAINSFSPYYSSNKLLKQIPLFKNCTDDFIREKQQALANYMGKIVEDNLINEETIEDLVQSKSTQIKDNIYKTIVENDYEKMYKCIENNNLYISSNLSLLTKNNLSLKSDKISEYISKNVSNLPIKQVFNRSVIDSIMDYFSSKNDELFNGITKYVAKRFGNGISFLDCIPNNVFNKIKVDIEQSLGDTYNDNINFIKNLDGLKKHFKKYKKSFDSFMNMTLISAFSTESIDMVESSVFNDLYTNIFTEEKLLDMSKSTYDVLNEYFSINNKLEDVLNRRNKVFLNGMFYKYFNDIVSSLKTYLIANRHDKIETDIKDKLLGSLNLREKNSYNLVGGDKALHDVINNLILIKLPIFFDRNFEQFYEISKAITNDIFESKLEDINFCFDSSKIDNFIVDLFDESRGDSVLKNKSYLLFRLYMQGYDNRKISEIAKYFNCDTIDNICNNYSDELTSILKQIHSNAKKNKLAIVRSLHKMVDDSTKQTLDSIPIKKLFNKIPKNDLINMKNYISNIIEQKDIICLGINEFINCFYNYLEDIDLLDSVIDSNELKLSLENIINKTIDNENFRAYIERLYSQIISEDLKINLSVYMPKRIKKYIVDLLVDGFYVAIKKNLNELFRGIELDKITKDEILNLPLDRFQQLFEIFYKNNKSNAVWTGALGGTIGANKYIGLIITILEACKSIPKIKIKKNKCQ